jgi:hypothetical protein
MRILTPKIRADRRGIVKTGQAASMRDRRLLAALIASPPRCLPGDGREGRRHRGRGFVDCRVKPGRGSCGKQRDGGGMEVP